MVSDCQLRIAAMGDLALGGEFIARHRPSGAPLTYPFAPLAESLRDVDLLLVNLEGPIGRDGVPRPGGSALLYNEPDVLDWLASFPICVCTLANNHSMDYGLDGLLRTRQLLKDRGIAHLGAGSNVTEARRELRLTIKGIRVGLLAFTTGEPHVGSVLAASSEPGCNPLPDREQLCGQVRLLATECDVVIVLLHWGYEYFYYPAPEQIELSRELCAAGALLVLGHHPHVPQGCEQLGRSLVCHSLGNLLLPEMRSASGRLQYRKSSTKEFSILHALFDRQGVMQWRLTGGRRDRNYRLVPHAGTAAERYASKMAKLSSILSRLDYEQFWISYNKTRKRELQIEGIKEMFVKLYRTDLKTIAKTLSLNDLRRLVSRITALGAKTRSPAASNSRRSN